MTATHGVHMLARSLLVDLALTPMISNCFICTIRIVYMISSSVVVFYFLSCNSYLCVKMVLYAQDKYWVLLFFFFFFVKTFTNDNGVPIVWTYGLSTIVVSLRLH